MKPPQEINFDGLVSPTHNYAGLSPGNLASTKNEGLIARPREAALQGLDKMKALHERGVPQAFFPPQLRPAIEVLRQLGFVGSDKKVLKSVYKEAPHLLASCSSASSMWTANAATVTPAIDSEDRITHFTPANLISNFHRSIEVDETTRALQEIFSNSDFFQVHRALPATPYFSDEGAANHTRLVNEDGTGLHLFVYGKSQDKKESRPKEFPARQTKEACEAIVRLHNIPADQVLYLQQNPKAIDGGVFHNDVISVGYGNVFLYHEKAFSEQAKAVKSIKKAYHGDLSLIEVPEADVSLQDAVETYLFNSQIVSQNGDENQLLLLCPIECEENSRVRAFIEKHIIAADTPIVEVIYQDLRQSMKNGGGPACLRLRVPLGKKAIKSLPKRIFFSSKTEDFLRSWVESNYPEELELEDLIDMDRYKKNRKAIDQLWDWLLG